MIQVIGFIAGAILTVCGLAILFVVGLVLAVVLFRGTEE